MNEEQGEKVLPWMKIVIRNFSKSFMCDFDVIVLAFLHGNIEKEIQFISSNNDKYYTVARTQTLYSELINLYEHMRLKISQDLDFPNAMVSCVKLLSQIIKTGLILTQGLKESKWIGRILTAINFFPGQSDLIYDALLLVNSLKKVYYKPYSVILKCVLINDRHKQMITDPLVYMKITLLFRRLRALNFNNDRDQYTVLVTKIKPPTNLISWLMKLNVCGTTSIFKKLKYKRLTQQLIKKNLPELLLKTIRTIALDPYNFNAVPDDYQVKEVTKDPQEVFVIDLSSSPANHSSDKSSQKKNKRKNKKTVLKNYSKKSTRVRKFKSKSDAGVSFINSYSNLVVEADDSESVHESDTYIGATDSYSDCESETPVPEIILRNSKKNKILTRKKDKSKVPRQIKSNKLKTMGVSKLERTSVQDMFFDDSDVPLKKSRMDVEMLPFPCLSLKRSVSENTVVAENVGKKGSKNRKKLKSSLDRKLKQSDKNICDDSEETATRNVSKSRSFLEDRVERSIKQKKSGDKKQKRKSLLRNEKQKSAGDSDSTCKIIFDHEDNLSQDTENESCLQDVTYKYKREYFKKLSLKQNKSVPQVYSPIKISKEKENVNLKVLFDKNSENKVTETKEISGEISRNNSDIAAKVFDTSKVCNSESVLSAEWPNSKCNVEYKEFLEKASSSSAISDSNNWKESLDRVSEDSSPVLLKKHSLITELPASCSKLTEKVDSKIKYHSNVADVHSTCSSTTENLSGVDSTSETNMHDDLVKINSFCPDHLKKHAEKHILASPENNQLSALIKSHNDCSVVSVHNDMETIIEYIKTPTPDTLAENIGVVNLHSSSLISAADGTKEALDINKTNTKISPTSKEPTAKNYHSLVESATNQFENSFKSEIISGTEVTDQMSEEHNKVHTVSYGTKISDTTNSEKSTKNTSKTIDSINLDTEREILNASPHLLSNSSRQADLSVNHNAALKLISDTGSISENKNNSKTDKSKTNDSEKSEENMKTVISISEENSTSPPKDLDTNSCEPIIVFNRGLTEVCNWDSSENSVLETKDLCSVHQNKDDALLDLTDSQNFKTSIINKNNSPFKKSKNAVEDIENEQVNLYVVAKVTSDNSELCGNNASKTSVYENDSSSDFHKNLNSILNKVQPLVKSPTIETALRNSTCPVNQNVFPNSSAVKSNVNKTVCDELKNHKSDAHLEVCENNSKDESIPSIIIKFDEANKGEVTILSCEDSGNNDSKNLGMPSDEIDKCSDAGSEFLIVEEDENLDTNESNLIISEKILHLSVESQNNKVMSDDTEMESSRQANCLQNSQSFEIAVKELVKPSDESANQTMKTNQSDSIREDKDYLVRSSVSCHMEELSCNDADKSPVPQREDSGHDNPSNPDVSTSNVQQLVESQNVSEVNLMQAKNSFMKKDVSASLSLCTNRSLISESENLSTNKVCGTEFQFLKPKEQTGVSEKNYSDAEKSEAKFNANEIETLDSNKDSVSQEETLNKNLHEAVGVGSEETGLFNNSKDINLSLHTTDKFPQCSSDMNLEISDSIDTPRLTFAANKSKNGFNCGNPISVIKNTLSSAGGIGTNELSEKSKLKIIIDCKQDIKQISNASISEHIPYFCENKSYVTFSDISLRDKDRSINVDSGLKSPITHFASAASTEIFSMYRNRNVLKRLFRDEDRTDAESISRDDVSSNNAELSDETKSQNHSSSASEVDSDSKHISSDEEIANEVEVTSKEHPKPTSSSKTNAVDPVNNEANLVTDKDTSLPPENNHIDTCSIETEPPSTLTSDGKTAMKDLLPRQSVRLRNKAELKSKNNSEESTDAELPGMSQKHEVVKDKSDSESNPGENDDINLNAPSSSYENVSNRFEKSDNPNKLSSSQKSEFRKSTALKTRSKENDRTPPKGYSLRRPKSSRRKDDSANLGIDLNKLYLDSPSSNRNARSKRESKFVKLLTSDVDSENSSDSSLTVKRETRSSVAKSDKETGLNTPSYNLRNRKAFIAPAKLKI